MHAHHRIARLKANARLISDATGILERSLAAGSDVDPGRIKLELRRVQAATEDSLLFRIAALTWSVPVSNGFGRRLRYLVWDKHHNRLAGLIALGDPVFNLGARDKLVGWSARDRCARLTNVLDAYVLGALPPYTFLLGGKVVACLVRTREVYDDFQAKYGNSTGVISGQGKRPRLLLVTTCSALGRSSVYNRLKLHNLSYFEHAGFTDGWGHFHVSDELFEELKVHLRAFGHPYVKGNRFGQGPNWRLRTIREGLKSLGIAEETLHHGVRREVFVCKLAENAVSILKRGHGRPVLRSLRTVEEVAGAGISRWMLPRAIARPEFRSWKPESLIASLIDPATPALSKKAEKTRAAI